MKYLVLSQKSKSILYLLHGFISLPDARRHMINVSYASVKVRLVPTYTDVHVWEIIKYVGVKFQIRYEHATVRWYTLSHDEGVPKVCTCLYVRHKLDVRYM